MRRLWIVVLGFGVTACGILIPDGITHKELEVAPYKAVCTGEARVFCLQVRETGEETFGSMFEDPVGFDFEWGYEYVIAVEEEERDVPIADASSVVRRLERVISRSPAPAGVTFPLLLPSEWLEPLAGDHLGLLREDVELACPGSDCTDLVASAGAVPRVLLTLRLSGTPGERLEVVSWQPCSTAFGACPAAATAESLSSG